MVSSANAPGAGLSQLACSEGSPNVTSLQGITTPRTGTSAGVRSLASASTQDSMLGLSNIRRSPRWSLQPRRPPISPRKDLSFPNAMAYDPAPPEVTSRMAKAPCYPFCSSDTGRLVPEVFRTGQAGRKGDATRSSTSSPAPQRVALKSVRHSISLGFGSGSPSRPISPRLTPRAAPNNGGLVDELLDGGESLGPGSYNLPVVFGKSPHYSIKPRREPPGDQVPGPGTYEQVDMIFQDTPRSQWCLYKCAQRPNMGKPTRLARSNSEMPGPGDYIQAKRSSIGEGVSYTIRSRPKETVNNVPGPGTYGGSWTQFK